MLEKLDWKDIEEKWENVDQLEHSELQERLVHRVCLDHKDHLDP